MEYVIETHDLTKVYGTGRKSVTAVDHENLRVKKGSIFGILGPNGAGKTTLIMMLTGFTLPTSGTAKVLGYDIIKESLQIRKSVGLLPEGLGFYDHLTARQNLSYITALNDIPRDERDRRVEETLKIVGLDEFEDRKVGGFSRGMKQRLAIAQTLIKDPEILIFDEPTAGVDPEGARAFRDMASKLNEEQNKTIVICTHLLYEVGPLCTDIAIMNKGRFVVQGNVQEIAERMMAEEGYTIQVEARGEIEALVTKLKGLTGITSLGVKGDIITIKAARDVRPEIVRRTAMDGLEVLSIRRVEPSLEDLFMKYYQGEFEVVTRG